MASLPATTLRESTLPTVVGAALGLNAGGGNVGVAAVQLVGLPVLATAAKAAALTFLGPLLGPLARPSFRGWRTVARAPG